MEGVILNAGIIKVLWYYYSNVFLAEEHNPPHIHAIYNEDVAAIDFMTGEVLEGDLPAKALDLVREWLSINKDTLQEIWVTQEFRKIPPLE